MFFASRYLFREKRIIKIRIIIVGVTALNRGTSIYLTNLLGMLDILTQ